MKYFLFILLFQFSQLIVAQSFSEFLPISPFEGVDDSVIAFSDVDNDGDQDIFITGQAGTGGSSQSTTALYINEGENFYEITPSPFPILDSPYPSPKIVFFDFDGDNDEDILISGETEAGNTIFTFYTNDGGTFTEVSDPLIENFYEPSFDISDIDGDNDMDILISGDPSNLSGDDYVTKLYRNEGGSFTEVMDTPFEDKKNTIHFFDMDGDNDEDVLITNHFSGSVYTFTSYENNGGEFTEKDNIYFFSYITPLAISDVDGDNDKDVIISQNIGGGSVGENILIVMNDGEGNFSNESEPIIQDIIWPVLNMFDADNDGDDDLLLSGLDGNTPPPDWHYTTLHANDGEGNFTPVMGLPLDPVAVGDVGVADVDGDGDIDVLLTGQDSSKTRIAKLYLNDGLDTPISSLNVESSLECTLYPNVVIDNLVNLNINSEKVRKVDIEIVDINGRILQKQEEQLLFGKNHILINLINLAKGTYYMRVNDGEILNTRPFFIPHH